MMAATSRGRRRATPSPHSLRGWLVVKIVGSSRRQQLFTTWNKTSAASCFGDDPKPATHDHLTAGNEGIRDIDTGARDCTLGRHG